jgi:hypothetical protein
MIVRSLGFIVVIGALLTAVPATAKPFAEACYTVHGRLSQSNGVPSLRIWKIGTRHKLGVFDCSGKDESTQALPGNVKAKAGRYAERPVTGDFLVCPLHPEKQGEMQSVCIRKATHLVRVSQ